MPNAKKRASPDEADAGKDNATMEAEWTNAASAATGGAATDVAAAGTARAEAATDRAMTDAAAGATATSVADDSTVALAATQLKKGRDSNQPARSAPRVQAKCPHGRRRYRCAECCPGFPRVLRISSYFISVGAVFI